MKKRIKGGCGRKLWRCGNAIQKSKKHFVGLPVDRKVFSTLVFPAGLINIQNRLGWDMLLGALPDTLKIPVNG